MQKGKPYVVLLNKPNLLKLPTAPRQTKNMKCHDYMKSD